MAHVKLEDISISELFTILLNCERGDKCDGCTLLNYTGSCYDDAKDELLRRKDNQNEGIKRD